MDANELLSSKILSDVEIIADIFKIVKESGLEATGDRRVTSSRNDVCTLIPSQNGVTRFSPCAKSVGRYVIEYDANDITIVGGSALNVYDYKLRAFKERRGLGALEDYIKKKTSDIDIVWWPRRTSGTEIIISKSEAIVQLAGVFEGKLQENFNGAAKELEAKIKPYITNVSNTDELKIYVNGFQTRPAGVFNINVTFRIKDKSLKICDISIHDGGAGQKVDANGSLINSIQPMNMDPVYSNPTPGQPNSITYLTVNSVDIAVPNIRSFVKQQMLAFDNLIRLNEVKGFINYKRVEFIKQLLSNFNLNNQQNTNDLLEVFSTDSREYPSEIISAINTRVDESINKLDGQIIQICRAVNTANDAIVEELCTKTRLIVAEKAKTAETQRLYDLKTMVWGKHKNSPSSFKKEYRGLHNAIDSERVKVLQMHPSEYTNYSKKDFNTPLKEINDRVEEFKRQANARNRAVQEERRRQAAIRADQERRMYERQQQIAAQAAEAERRRQAAWVEEQRRMEAQAAEAAAEERRRQEAVTRHRQPSRPFMSAEPPHHYNRGVAPAPPAHNPPNFIPAFHPLAGAPPYGYAPRYPSPTFYAPFYVEALTGRHMQYDPRGFWYYLTPPLPRGPPPQGRRLGGDIQTRKNRNRNNNNTKKRT